MEAARTSESNGKAVLLGFHAGQHHYLIDGRDVAEVHPITAIEPMPIAKPWVLGAANIKGSVFSVTDFSVLMGTETVAPSGGRRGKFLALSNELMRGAALLVDGLSGLFEPDAIGQLRGERLDGMPPWISGEHLIGHSYFLVDAQMMSVDPRFSKLQRGESQ